MHRDLPSTIMNLVVYESNLAWLCDDIDAHWGDRAWSYLGFERSQLRGVPTAVGRLNAGLLFINHNEIEELPSDFFVDSKFSLLTLSDNPLRALPDDITPPLTRVFDIQATDTKITAAPKWLRDWVNADKLLYSTLAGTPYCDARTSSNALGVTSPPSTGDASEAAAASRLCVERLSQNFPVELLLPERQP